MNELSALSAYIHQALYIFNAATENMLCLCICIHNVYTPTDPYMFLNAALENYWPFTSAIITVKLAIVFRGNLSCTIHNIC